MERCDAGEYIVGSPRAPLVKEFVSFTPVRAEGSLTVPRVLYSCGSLLGLVG